MDNRLKAGFSRLIVICIGLAISTIGIYYNELEVPKLYISCATFAALFFTIIDFIEVFFVKDTIEALEGKNKVHNWIIKRIYKSKNSIITLCLITAIFSIIFFPFVPQIEKLLNGLNDQLSIISLGLVIFILGLKHLDYEKNNLEEYSGVMKEYKKIAETAIKDLEKLRDDYEELIIDHEKAQKENVMLRSNINSTESPK